MPKKKKLTKRERQLRQFKREQAAREAKKALDNAVEKHLFEKGDLVKVNGNVGVIADYNEDLLYNKHWVGAAALSKTIDDFTEVVMFIDKMGTECFPPKFMEFMEHIVPSALRTLENFAENEQAAFFLDIPVEVIIDQNGFKVMCNSVYANRGTKHYVVWNGMFEADNWLKLNIDGEEGIVSEGVTEDLDYWSGSSSQETSGISGIFEELAQQAYAVKAKKSKNLGLYKVHYTGEMLGQYGKQQVWVAPCNIQEVV